MLRCIVLLYFHYLADNSEAFEPVSLYTYGSTGWICVGKAKMLHWEYMIYYRVVTSMSKKCVSSKKVEPQESWAHGLKPPTLSQITGVRNSVQCFQQGGPRGSPKPGVSTFRAEMIQ